MWSRDEQGLYLAKMLSFLKVFLKKIFLKNFLKENEWNVLNKQINSVRSNKLTKFFLCESCHGRNTPSQ